MKRVLSAIFLVAAAAFGPVVFLLIRRSEMTHLHWLLAGAVPVWLLLFGLHYLVFGPAPARRRFARAGAVLLAVALAGGILSRVLRYEGSTSGSSFPKFSWVWEEPATGPESPAPPAIGSGGGIPSLAGSLEDLPDFLGPERDGMWERPSFGTDWSRNPPQLLWRRPIGKGWSGFTVSGTRALTQQQSGDDELVTCLDVASGADLWNHSDPETRLLLEHAENGGAAMGGDGPRATPVIHGDRVYTMGSTGIIHCLDLETGREIWTRHLLREVGAATQRWGMANSPLVLTEPPLVVFAGSDRPGATLVACDPATGETRWTHRGNGASYSSPRLLVLAGKAQIVSVNATDASGVDPGTGEALWTHPWPMHFPKVAQPLALPGDRLLLTASYGAGSLLLSVSRDDAGSFSTAELWRSTYLKTKFSSPVVLGDHAFGLDEGRLACIDLATGKRVWKREKFGFGQNLLFGEWLLVQTEPGDVVVGRLGAEGFAESGRIPALSSMTWNTPAVAGRVLLVRNDREASAWLLPEP